MTAKIIDGKKLASEARERIKEVVKELEPKPLLAVIQVGDNPASNIYIRKKNESCEDAGILFEHHKLEENVTESEVVETIKKLNNREEVSGIILQLPVSENLDKYKLLELISPGKDVDGLHPLNIGKLHEDRPVFIPATPKGIIKLIESTGVEIKGKSAVVIGRSNLVGKPISRLLTQKSATVTVCHSKTKNMSGITREADILVVAIGKPKLVTEDMVKEGAVVIDVGINRVDGRLCGDVDFENVKEKAAYITPVPGGVGPMTVAMLLENVLIAYKNKRGVE